MTFSRDSSASLLSRCSRMVAADRGGGGVDDMASSPEHYSAPNLRTVSNIQSRMYIMHYPLNQLERWENMFSRRVLRVP